MGQISGAETLVMALKKNGVQRSKNAIIKSKSGGGF